MKIVLSWSGRLHRFLEGLHYVTNFSINLINRYLILDIHSGFPSRGLMNTMNGKMHFVWNNRFASPPLAILLEFSLWEISLFYEAIWRLKTFNYEWTQLFHFLTTQNQTDKSSLDFDILLGYNHNNSVQIMKVMMS